MIEALVSLRLQGETDHKKRGDILVAKLAPCAWSVTELTQGQLIEIEDAELEARVVEAGGVLSYPYAIYDDEGNMLERSSRKLDLDALPDEKQTLALDPTIAAPLLQCHECDFKDEE